MGAFSNVAAGADRSVALGGGTSAADSARVGANSANAVAIGSNANIGANASGSTAIGSGATVNAGVTNAVALVQGSVASASNTVSVGAAGAERRVTNVAPAVNGTDAVNLDQLNAALAGISDNSLAASKAYTDEQIGKLRKEAFIGIAQAAALVPMTPSSSGETTLNVGVASYGGYIAAGLAVAHQIGRQTILNGGVGLANEGRSLVRVGVGVRF
jgi:autotransporter adhesin